MTPTTEPEGPQRTCIGCRTTTSAAELTRISRSSDGVLSPSSGGRGAWLCAATLEACLAAATDRKAFARAFRAPVSQNEVASLRQLLLAEGRLSPA